MLKKAILLFSILCMLIIMVSCGGNPIIPPVEEEGNIHITDMFWVPDDKVIEITLNQFPSTWGDWTMYINGEKLSMEEGTGKPVVAPNADLDEPPTGLYVGTLPWLGPLTEVDFPCCGIIQFDIPGEGLTNEYEFNLINFGCETASEEECSQTPTIDDDVDQEYIVEEKYFNVDANLGGTFNLDDGTEVKIDPGDLSDDAYLVIKKVNYDLELSKIHDNWNPHNIYIYIVDIFDVKDLLGPVDLYMVSNQVENLAGGIIRVKDDTFELVKEFTNAEGGKVQVAIEEIGKCAYMFVTNPVNDLLILNDSVTDINSAVQYYYDGSCASLFGLYQLALQEEEIAGDDLENYPGVTREDAEEIFAEVNSWKTVIDLAADLITKLAPNPVTAAYSIYSTFIGLGEICQYYNAYMVAENKTNIYKSKIFKRRVIRYLYEQGCIGENHPPVISDLSANPPSVDINQTTTITCIASDLDGDTLTYYWTKTGGTFEGSTTSSSITWRAPSTEGNYTVECEVSDGEGGEGSESVNIIVTESENPENGSNDEIIFDISCNPIEIYSNFKVSCNPRNQLSDDLTWTWEIPYLWNESITYNEIDYIWGNVLGYACTFTIYCTIDDGINEYSGSLEVEVVNTHEDDTEEIISVIQEFQLAMNNLNWEKAKSCCVYESSLYDWVLSWEHYYYPELHLITDFDVDLINVENINWIFYDPMFFYDDGLEALVIFTVGGTNDGESITAYDAKKINNTWKIDV